MRERNCKRFLFMENAKVAPVIKGMKECLKKRQSQAGK